MFKIHCKVSTNQIVIKYSNSADYFRFSISSTSFFISSANTSTLAFAIQSLHLWIFASQWFEWIWLMSLSNPAMLTLKRSLNSFHLFTSSLFILWLASWRVVVDWHFYNAPQSKKKYTALPLFLVDNHSNLIQDRFSW